MVICLKRGADLHMAQLTPLPLTVSCFSKIQIGFTFSVPAHPGSPGKRAVKRVCVCPLFLILPVSPFNFTVSNYFLGTCWCRMSVLRLSQTMSLCLTPLVLLLVCLK